MQIREAEHRHRAELAAEQERVREAHEMVELIQSGMPRSWTCPVGTCWDFGTWEDNFDISKYFKYELRIVSNNFDERKHGSSFQGHGMPLIPQQVTVARERANKDVTAARAREALLEGAAGCRWSEEFARVNPGQCLSVK